MQVSRITFETRTTLHLVIKRETFITIRNCISLTNVKYYTSMTNVKNTHVKYTYLSAQYR